MSTREQPEPIDSEIRAIVRTDDAWVAAFNAADIDRLVALYTADAVIMPPGMESLTGRETIRAWLQSFFARFRAEQEIIHDEVQVAGDWAYLRGRYSLAMTPTGGAEPVSERGKHLVIWRRQPDGSWLAARDIWNRSDPA